MNPDYLETKELYHFGVIGMKWGHHKPEDEPSKKNPDYSIKETKDIKTGKARFETNDEYKKTMSNKAAIIGGVAGGLYGFKEGGKRSLIFANSILDPSNKEEAKLGRTIIIGRTLAATLIGSFVGSKIGKFGGKKLAERNLNNKTAVKGVKYANK